jgi:hypothetical protein
MTGINGRELAKRAQQIRPHLKVVYMTGYSRNALFTRGTSIRDSIYWRSLSLNPSWPCDSKKCSIARPQSRDRSRYSKASAQPYTECIARRGIWLDPELLAELEYRTKSAECKVRHSFFNSLREVRDGRARLNIECDRAPRNSRLRR